MWVDVFNHQLLPHFSLSIETQKNELFFPSIPLLSAFAQVFLRPDVKKEPAGPSEGKHQLINWAQIRSCVIVAKVAFFRSFVVHSPASSGQSCLLMGRFNFWPAEVQAEVRVKCFHALDDF